MAKAPRTGGSRLVGLAIVAVVLVVLFMWFAGGDRPDQMAPTADEAPVVTTDPIAPADATPSGGDPIDPPAQPADPIDPIDPIEQDNPQPILE
jgi:hypothetical protein